MTFETERSKTYQFTIESLIPSKLIVNKYS